MKKLMFVAAFAALSTSAFAETYAYDIKLTYKASQIKAEKTKTYTVTVGQDNTGRKWYERCNWLDAAAFKTIDDESKENIAIGSFGFDPETGTSDYDNPIPGEKSLTFKYKASANGEYYLAPGTTKKSTRAAFDSIGADSTSDRKSMITMENIVTHYIGGATPEKAKKVIISGDIYATEFAGKFSGTGSVDKNGIITSVSGEIVGKVYNNNGERRGKCFEYDPLAGALVAADPFDVMATAASGTFTMKYSKKLSQMLESQMLDK